MPFLEHDDANRALMGANMKRQAVPLLIPEPPLVATGMEDGRRPRLGRLRHRPPFRQGHLLVRRPYRGRRRQRKGKEEAMDLYTLRKYTRSNQDTCINQSHDGRDRHARQGRRRRSRTAPTAEGQLALGRNLLVGFMPWEGYNYEDAILLSERLVKDDVFHLHPHLRVRGRGSRHQARTRRDHARHPERRHRGS